MLRRVNRDDREAGGLLLPPLGDRRRPAAHRRHRRQDAFPPLREHPAHGRPPAAAAGRLPLGPHGRDLPRPNDIADPGRCLTCTDVPTIERLAPEDARSAARGTPSSWPARRPRSSTAPAGSASCGTSSGTTRTTCWRAREGRITGVLPLAHVKSLLFGNALTSLPVCRLRRRGGRRRRQRRGAGGRGADASRSSWACSTWNCATPSAATPTGPSRTCTSPSARRSCPRKRPTCWPFRASSARWCARASRTD